MKTLATILPPSPGLNPEKEANGNYRSAGIQILRLDSVSLAFGGVLAVNNVSLSAAEREILAVIGPNGAGKSSILNIISGIYCAQGSVWLAETKFTQVPTRRLAHYGIARTFQNLAIFKGLTVLENVVLGRSATFRSNLAEQILGAGRARRESLDARERAEEILDFLELRDVRDRAASTLPYGTQKRVEFARALVARPKILLLDEPMAGMTSVEKQRMARFIRAARDEFGTTVILIEHDIGIVMDLSDHVVVLDHGRKIADGSPEEVRNNQDVIDAYIGVAHDDESEEEAYV